MQKSSKADYYCKCGLEKFASRLIKDSEDNYLV
jgi:hypothetical protein